MNNWVPIASIIVSVIAAIAAIVTSRSSTRASVVNTRTNAEAEAYIRARKLDVETIERQDAEIEELKEKQIHLNDDVKMVNGENGRLHEENVQLHEEIRRLRARITRVERGIPFDDTSPIRMRESDEYPTVDIERVDDDGRE